MLLTNASSDQINLKSKLPELYILERSIKELHQTVRWFTFKWWNNRLEERVASYGERVLDEYLIKDLLTKFEEMIVTDLDLILELAGKSHYDTGRFKLEALRLKPIYLEKIEDSHLHHIEIKNTFNGGILTWKN